MTFRSVPSIMMFCMPVAKRFGHISQRITSRAVLEAMNSEHSVCCEIGNGARDER